jgi:hypothetical protein
MFMGSGFRLRRPRNDSRFLPQILFSAAFIAATRRSTVGRTSEAPSADPG